MSKNLYGLAVDIAAAMKNRRKELGLTQRDLAKLAHTSHSAIARWESADYTGHSLAKLDEVFQALNLEIGLTFNVKGEA